MPEPDDAELMPLTKTVEPDPPQSKDDTAETITDTGEPIGSNFA